VGKIGTEFVSYSRIEFISMCEIGRVIASIHLEMAGSATSSSSRVLPIPATIMSTGIPDHPFFFLYCFSSLLLCRQV